MGFREPIDRHFDAVGGLSDLPGPFSRNTLPSTRSPSHGCLAMLKRVALLAAVAGAFVLALYASTEKPEPKEKPLPAMKFNDVVELAPGVFFRYSSISAD